MFYSTFFKNKIPTIYFSLTYNLCLSMSLFFYRFSSKTSKNFLSIFFLDLYLLSLLYLLVLAFYFNLHCPTTGQWSPPSRGGARRGPPPKASRFEEPRSFRFCQLRKIVAKVINNRVSSPATIKTISPHLTLNL